ncbi:LysR family transcriptional regulator [Achromobacter aloeverae]|uniref:LysR family transcriptional regulator n=1 Tax=Achromobacter aloeverae TaxID=1750518 RepID=A0A4Q1HCR6_9BURK|nr:LysR family transcriptional regulator [Achromobacter aloeverae]RXN83377.1 LysR family transcriptional regulator [Achromobacter aloeverae]
MENGDIAYGQLCGWLKARHLVLIDTLARTQNMHAAAQQMNLTQPALSKMLRDIEALLGFGLFERLPRSMPPTELGAHVAAYARMMLNDTAKFVAQINKLRRGGHGHVKIGAIFAATFNVLPEAIARVKEQRPLLSVEILEQTSDKLLDMLERKEIDIVIGRFREDRHRQLFDFTALGAEPFALVGNARHPLARKRKNPTPVAALRDWPWVLYPAGTPIRERIDEAFHGAGVEPPGNTVETISMPTFLQLLHSGTTIALLPVPMIQEQLDQGRLRILDSRLKVQPLEYGVIRRKDEPLSATARLFTETLIAQSDERRARA